MKDINELKAEVMELEKAKLEKDEYNALLKRKKELLEEGTLKKKIKDALVKVRGHLHEKGKQFKDNGDKIAQKDKPTMFQETPIAQMMNEGSPVKQNNLFQEPFSSPLYKELTKKEEKKKKD